MVRICDLVDPTDSAEWTPPHSQNASATEHAGSSLEGIEILEEGPNDLNAHRSRGRLEAPDIPSLASLDENFVRISSSTNETKLSPLTMHSTDPQTEEDKTSGNERDRKRRHPTIVEVESWDSSLSAACTSREQQVEASRSSSRQLTTCRKGSSSRVRSCRSNYPLSSRGVSRLFTEHIWREWESLSQRQQVCLLDWTVFPSSFSLWAAKAVHQASEGGSADPLALEEMNGLMATSLMHVDPVNGRVEVNERVRNLLRRKARELGYELSYALESFVSFFLGELRSYEDTAKKDTANDYAIATKNFELERPNILHAFKVARETDGETYSSRCLVGNYLMRYTLDGKSRVEIYKQALEDMASGSIPRESWEDQRRCTQLLLANGRAMIDSLSFREAKEPLLECEACLQSLLKSAADPIERKSLVADLIVVNENLAKLHNALGEHEVALPYIVEALKSRKATGGTGSLPFAICMGVFVNVLMDLGDYEHAHQVLLSQLEMLENNQMENSHDYAVALWNLAKIMKRDGGDVERARHCLEDSLNCICKSMLPYKNYAFLEGAVLQDLGETLEAMGKQSEADRNYRLAKKYFGTAGFPKKKAELEKKLEMSSSLPRQSQRPGKSHKR